MLQKDEDHWRNDVNRYKTVLHKDVEKSAPGRILKNLPAQSRESMKIKDLFEDCDELITAIQRIVSTSSSD